MTEAETQLADLIRENAGGKCERCGATESLDVYNTGDGAVSMDTLELLCPSCHSGKKLTPSAVLGYLNDHWLPFITVSMVADEFDVADATARDAIDTLVAQEDLQRYEHNSRQVFYFRPDYGAASTVIDGLREHIDIGDLDPGAVKAFARKPYKILPRGDGEYYVLVPEFLKSFSLGHLHDKDDAWRVYVVNRYVKLYSDLPDDVADQITLRQQYDHAELDGQILELSDREEREAAWENFGGRDGGLHRRVDDTKIQVQQGEEFNVIAKLIDGGNLPFAPSEVDHDHLRAAPSNVSLREYQQEAWETFLDYGQVGIFWPPGLGKSWFSLYAGGRIEGEKLVVVPSSTLREQWRERVDEQAPDPDDWRVETYQYLTHGDGSNLDEFQGDDAPRLTIYDEVHHIAANKFSKLSMIESDYRLGLSASPYREDGREEYIFALTGMPVGVNWQDLVEYGHLDYPEVHVYSYRTERQKREDLLDIAQTRPGNGLVFCDSLERGEAIADDLDVPFVNGDTPADERMDLIRDNRVAVVSRIADEGMSFDELDWSVEHDFLGKSRRQETQRAGRLMHSDGSFEEGDDGNEMSGIHIIQMTDSELDKHSERLYGLEEKGLNIQFERRA